MLTARPRMARVENKADTGLADVFPQASDRINLASHRVLPSGSVLDENLYIGFNDVERLAPARELQVLATRNADAVVRRCDVDQIRGVHVEGQAGTAKLLGIVARRRLLPALWVAQKELYEVGSTFRSLRQRLHTGRVGSNELAAHVDSM